ncbi:MAG TPA: M20/M25/M40 family metallo-hydrolase [Phycisphaerae bacterium]|nr:M20/M25/M40 family metallo-hydrolase [Phycisphaerae bacterium]
MSIEENDKRFLLRTVDQLAPMWRELALRIHGRPEPALQEHQACAWLSAALEQAGFEVVRGVAGMSTSFVATWDTSAEAPVIALMAEYDALENVGHACGHNLSGAASCLAAHALAKAEGDRGVRLRVFGTPGEEDESAGGKIRMLEQGLLKDVDFAMMAHAGFMNLPSREMLTRRSIDLEFRSPGAQDPGAAEPDGSALDAVVMVFSAMVELRRDLTPWGRLDGVITEGGTMVRNRPKCPLARAEIAIRATRIDDLDELERRLHASARSAAEVTGTVLSWSSRPGRYLPMRRNPAMEAAYEKNMHLLGEEAGCFPPDEPIGSTDFGNVSQVLPGIHAYFRTAPREVKHHTPAYTEASRSEAGLVGMVVAAKAMALTALDLARDSALRQAVRADFRRG